MGFSHLLAGGRGFQEMGMLTLTAAKRRDGVVTKGEWRGAKVPGDPPRRSATVCCPGCGKIASLTGHTIADDGAVMPSLICPFDCGFHDHVKLEGWKA